MEFLPYVILTNNIFTYGNFTYGIFTYGIFTAHPANDYPTHDWMPNIRRPFNKRKTSTHCWLSVGPPLRRRPNIKPTMGKCLALAKLNGSLSNSTHNNILL